MKGKVTEVGAGVDGRKLARIELEGVEGAVQIAYWPELLKQWGPDRLRGWLIAQAEAQVVDDGDDDDHAALVGEGEAAPIEPEAAPAVCNLGASGCVVEHPDTAEELAAPAHSAEPRGKMAAQ